MSVAAWNKLSKGDKEFVISTLGEAIASIDSRPSAYPPDFGTGLYTKEDALAPFQIAISALKELSDNESNNT
jgi:hypothetical protein